MVSVILESSDLWISVVLSGIVVTRGRCREAEVLIFEKCHFVKLCWSRVLVTSRPGVSQNAKHQVTKLHFHGKSPWPLGVSPHSEGRGRRVGAGGEQGVFSLWNLKQGATGNFQDWITNSTGPTAGMSGITRDSATRDPGWWRVQLAPF